MKYDLYLSLRLYLISAIILIIYNLILYGAGNSFWQEETQGSLIRNDDGHVKGSYLISQKLENTKYFRYRPQPMFLDQCHVALYHSKFKKALTSLVKKNKPIVSEEPLAIGEQNTNKAYSDITMLTSSASGLDPYITKAEAIRQIPLVAAKRGINPKILKQLVDQQTIKASFPFFTNDIINVTKLNILLDSVNEPLS